MQGLMWIARVFRDKCRSFCFMDLLHMTHTLFTCIHTYIPGTAMDLEPDVSIHLNLKPLEPCSFIGINHEPYTAPLAVKKLKPL